MSALPIRTRGLASRPLLAFLSVIVLLATLVTFQQSASAQITNDGMAPPYNDNGHPRSWILLSGSCGVVYCEARYKIQYSFWGWHTSGNSEIIVPFNQISYTGAYATCNKSPGTYRGRLDLKLVNQSTTSISLGIGSLGGSITIDGLATKWIRSSSPHTTGLRC